MSQTAATPSQTSAIKVPAEHAGLELPKSAVENMDRRLIYVIIGLCAVAFGGVSAFAMSSSKTQTGQKTEPSNRFKLPHLPKEPRTAAVIAAPKLDAPDAHVRDEYDDVDPNDPIFHTPITALPPNEREIPGYNPRGHAAAVAREAAQENAASASAASTKQNSDQQDAEWGGRAPAADSLQPLQRKQGEAEPASEASLPAAREVRPTAHDGEEPSDGAEDQQERWAARKGDVPRITAWRDRARCQVDAGRSMEVHLMSAINTDIAGQNFTLSFMVDETIACGDRVAIRQGARLAGSANTRVAYGQNRVQACGNVIYMQANARHPHGYEIPLGCIPMAEANGAIGVPGAVNRHWGDKLSGGLFSMLFSIGATAAAGTQTTFGSTVGQRVAQGAAQSASNIGQTWSAAAFARKDTIELVGQTTRLIFNRAIVIPDGGEEP